MIMDYSAEQLFVNSFIRKKRRERLLYELTTPGKRYDGISRFCHQSAELLDPSKIKLEGTDMDRNPIFEDFLRDHDEECFVLSPEFYPEVQQLPLKDAVRYASMSTDAALIIGSNFAVVYGEAMKGGRDKFLCVTDGDGA